MPVDGSHLSQVSELVQILSPLSIFCSPCPSHLLGPSTTLDARRTEAGIDTESDELRRLFDAARESTRTFRGLSGADRYYLYLVTAGTGFRANAWRT